MIYAKPGSASQAKRLDPRDRNLRLGLWKLLSIARDEAISVLRNRGLDVDRSTLDAAYTMIRAEYKERDRILREFDRLVADKRDEIIEQIMSIEEALEEGPPAPAEGEEPIDENAWRKALEERKASLQSLLDLLEFPYEPSDEDKQKALEPLKDLDPDLHATLISELSTYHDSIRSALFDLQERIALQREAVESKRAEQELADDDPDLVELRRLMEIARILSNALRIRGRPKPEVLQLFKPDWACLPIWGESE